MCNLLHFVGEIRIYGVRMEVCMGVEENLLESDSHENQKGMGIAIWVIRGIEIKQQKRFINAYIQNYR